MFPEVYDLLTILGGDHRSRRNSTAVRGRQVPVGKGLLDAARRLWRPTAHPWRWNDVFPTLYTSLTLAISFAERIKRYGATPIDVLVGIADASIARTIDLTDSAALALLGLTVGDLMTEDHTLTRALGMAFFQAGVTALLVPAAIETTARQYPRFRVVRDGRITNHRTPAGGTNVVIFHSNRKRGDGWRERRSGRFVCEIAGLSV